MHEIIGPLVEMQRNGDMAGLLAFTRMTGDLVKAMRACPQPIVAAIDGDIGLTQCSVHVDECARTSYCPTRPHWAAINRAVGETLSAISLDAMLTPAATTPPAR